MIFVNNFLFIAIADTKFTNLNCRLNCGLKNYNAIISIEIRDL